MTFIRIALYFGFGWFLAHIGYSFMTWQYWTAMAFIVATDVVSHLKAVSR